MSFSFRLLPKAPVAAFLILTLLCGQSLAQSLDNSSSRDSIVIQHIEIQSRLNTSQTIKIPVKSQNKIRQEFEPGDDWQGNLKIIGQGPIDNIALTITHTNVLSLQDEGPHLDLFDWQTFKSDELRVDKLEGNTQTFVLEERYFTIGAFPFITQQDLFNGIQKTINRREEYRDKSDAIKRWTSVAKRCSAPQAYPCTVGVGSVLLKFFDQGQKNQKPVLELDIVLPQGC